jgi:hypothetical protein
MVQPIAQPRGQTIQQGARIVFSPGISAKRGRRRCEKMRGTMYYETLRQHSYEHISRKASGLGDVAGARECLLDAIDAPMPALPERETQWVMDQLLRECLKRKPLS